MLHGALASSGDRRGPEVALPAGDEVAAAAVLTALDAFIVTASRAAALLQTVDKSARLPLNGFAAAANDTLHAASTATTLATGADADSSSLHAATVDALVTGASADVDSPHVAALVTGARTVPTSLEDPSTSSVKHSDALDRQFMRAALMEAEAAVADGNHPFGAVLVLDGEVVLLGRNAVVTENDATRHAELVLASAAGKMIPRAALSQATMYTSTAPCPMCSGAIYWTGMTCTCRTMG